MSKMCIHCVISGRVQGVWYRSGALKEALSLGLTGWVKNRDSNDVELIACGTKEQLEKFKAWLWQGPGMANVTNVACEELPMQEFDAFEVRS